MLQRYLGLVTTSKDQDITDIMVQLRFTIVFSGFELQDVKMCNHKNTIVIARKRLQISIESILRQLTKDNLERRSRNLKN